jgi:hypothetical protein
MFGPPCKRKKRDNSRELDLSYWDTYSLQDNYVFLPLLEAYVYNAHIYGIKNFRTDKLSNRQFFSFTNYSDKQYYGNDWKTAHLTRLYIDANPHWNLSSQEPLV